MKNFSNIYNIIMEKVNYKTYQQVLNIVVNSASAANLRKTVKSSTIKSEKSVKVAKPKKTTPPTKRRTKSGCLTCRKRKKKCDEDKVNGKCQGCTRNFLECCWPKVESLESSKVEVAAVSELPTPATTPLLCPTSPVYAHTPVQSHNPAPYKRTPASDVSAKCSISSLLLQDAYPSPVHSPVQEHKEGPNFLSLENKKESVETKFIITSFDSHKDLCEVK